MKNYYRVMLGPKSIHAEECLKGGFIGTDFIGEIDLSKKLPDDWRVFNKEFRPIWLAENPGKSKISAGLACGALWTVSKGILTGDIVLCPNGDGSYLVGEITGSYQYRPGEILLHRRPVRWLDKTIERSAMSDALQKSTGSIGTLSNVTKYADEIAILIGETAPPKLIATDETIEDLVVFAMEKYLEDFLVSNWKHTELGKRYDIFEEDGELVGKQYPSDTGPMDILAVSKDKKELLVVELKKGRASDVVVGQIQRYMGFALEELAENNQTVKGVIIALEDDIRLRRALAVTSNIEFYKYQIKFKLIKS
jgi:restriction system protein